MAGQDRVDLNSDLGESFGPWRMGDDPTMLGLVTSANVACGGHASDPETMFETLTLARDRKVVVGAHPGYPDKEGFGRRRLPCTTAEIERFCAAQIGALTAVAALARWQVSYVKPHGALGNLAAEDTSVAAAIARAVKAIDPRLAMLAMSRSALETESQRLGIATYGEIFADRAYTPAGRLVPRGTPGAMIEDADAAALRLVRFFETGEMPVLGGGTVALQAHSVCIHGDSAHAVAMARRVKAALQEAGLSIRPFLEIPAP